MKTIIEKIRERGLIERGQSVLCAVSGGADSMCLLHVLSENAEALGIRVCAAHFDHRLRGAESDRDREFVRDYCDAHGIPCVIGGADVAGYAQGSGMGTEEAARSLRYAFLSDAARELDCELIATAHNCDDNAETVLLKLTRGTGARGLRGIPERRGEIIRPLLFVTREEIETYDAENGVPYVTDSSNLTDDYARNVIRHRVMPVLRELNPAFSASALRTAGLIAADDEYLTEQARLFKERYYKDKTLPVRELKELTEPVSSRVLRLICGSSLEAGQTGAILALCGAEGLHHCDIKGLRVTKDGGLLCFGVTARKIPDTVLSPGQTVSLTERGLTVSAETVPSDGEIFKSLNIFYFNCAAVCGTITLTSRRDGDKLRLAGRGCTKSLKELFREAGMTQTERDETLVLRDERGVIAVCGFGVAERCAVKSGEPMLKITVKQTETI